MTGNRRPLPRSGSRMRRHSRSHRYRNAVGGTNSTATPFQDWYSPTNEPSLFPQAHYSPISATSLQIYGHAILTDPYCNQFADGVCTGIPLVIRHSTDTHRRRRQRHLPMGKVILQIQDCVNVSTSSSTFQPVFETKMHNFGGVYGTAEYLPAEVSNLEASTTSSYGNESVSFFPSLLRTSSCERMVDFPITKSNVLPPQ